MHREYILQGLGCANCGNKIESAVKAVNGVSAAAVNFLTSTLKIETSEAYAGNIDQDVEKIVHKFEPEVVIIEKTRCAPASAHPKAITSGLIKLLTGAAIFAVGVAGSWLFSLNQYVEFGIFLASYILLGGGVLRKAARNISKGQVFDENFLMGIATLGAFAIGDFAEAAGVMLFYQVGEYFQERAVAHSKKSISELMDIRPDFAHVQRDKQWVTVSPEAVAVGDLVMVKPGEKVPLDGVVTQGQSMLDTSALTGESLPRKAEQGDLLHSGSINQSGMLIIKVTKTFGESTVSRILKLVENAGEKKAPTENFITTFARYYTPAVVGLAVLLALLPPLFWGELWSDWVHRALIFLVVSCPCALVISIPLSYFGGIGGASKRGVLVKGANYLEALNNLDIVVFDKTGTLTKGVFEVTDIEPAENYTSDEVVYFAALAESYSNHPIARSILRACSSQIPKDDLRDYRELAGKGVSVLYNGQEILAGSADLLMSKGLAVKPTSGLGSKVYVAVGGRYVGVITISDEVKSDSRATVMGLKDRGISKTVMLTGDDAVIAETIADQLNLDQVYSQLLPDQKVSILEKLELEKKAGAKLAYVGDGINDAPVLARADVGIAMGGLGSDAAIEAADVVLMTDEPAKLIDAIDIAAKTKSIVWQNIVFALGVKAACLILGALGLATMWEAVFADVGVMLLAILNAMRLLRF